VEMLDERVVRITARIQNGECNIRYCSDYVPQLQITDFIA
jgi:hypothetical protein